MQLQRLVKLEIQHNSDAFFFFFFLKWCTDSKTSLIKVLTNKFRIKYLIHSAVNFAKIAVKN